MATLRIVLAQLLFLTVTLPCGGSSVVPSAQTAKAVKRRIVKAKANHDFARFRRILVSPSVNTPKPFKGFGGFCGWPKVHRLQNGDLFVAFQAGYWHASWPTPFDMPVKFKSGLLERYPWMKKLQAPEGGRDMWIRSTDNGKTWTCPQAFPVVRGLEGIVDVIQLKDGTMFAGADIETHRGYLKALPTDPIAFLKITAGRFPQKICIFRSSDNGKSWAEIARLQGPYLLRCTLQDFLEGADGSLLAFTVGDPFPTGRGWPTGRTRSNNVAILRSEDNGLTWTTRAVFGNDDPQNEKYAARLPNGNLGMASRPTSRWWESTDDGRTWVDRGLLLRDHGIMRKGDIVITPDGVTVVVFCGGKGSVGGNGQVIYSRDNGNTWIMPAKDRGFKFDPLSYYPDACVLSDGSIFVVGSHEGYNDKQGFENPYGPYGAESVAMRFRIRKPQEGEGIELLPIGGPSEGH